MRTFIHFLSFKFFLLLSIWAPYPNFALEVPDGEHSASFDQYTQSLASLVFYTHESLKSFKDKKDLQEDVLAFSKEDVEGLFDQSVHGLYCSNFLTDQIKSAGIFEKAYIDHEEALRWAELGDTEKAFEFLRSSSNALNNLWLEAIDAPIEENLPSYEWMNARALRAKKDPNFNRNRYLSSSRRRAVKPHLLPLQHPMHSVLDEIFFKTRATVDSTAFRKAGFKTIAIRPRSFIRVARHRELPGYLVKAYLDTELRKKQYTGSLEWLIQRCIGAAKVRAIIRKYDIRHFVVPDKWIYCLPAEPSPPKDNKHKRHLALLLVTDMNLASNSRNYQACLITLRKST